MYKLIIYVMSYLRNGYYGKRRGEFSKIKNVEVTKNMLIKHENMSCMQGWGAGKFFSGSGS